MKDSLNNDEDVVFSLDIGTRTVIGIVGIYKEDKLNIIASSILEHEKRAMHDGQIHDINSVVKVAKKVKEDLESQIEFKLKEVSIAAAGRALETNRVKVKRDIDFTREINNEIIKSIELEAVQKAQEDLKDKLKIEENKYYCVGYTAVNYFLDDILIENLEGHRGDNITVEIIATFLPHTVIDSLTTVVDRLGLEVTNMTLEPIAALNVAVKKNLRLLNISLIDVGAGTSDIAITKDGTVNAYAMVSTAGDEITEKLVTKYLLDYDVAEDLKVNLNTPKTHEFQDIVGTIHRLTTEEILDTIDESIRQLAKDISSKVIELNERSPSVVFLIGGGSQTPRLSKYISEELDMPEDRVVIKDTNLIENITGISDHIKGPNAITPIGIAMISAENNYRDFIEITINGEKVKLFNTENSRITDALLIVNYNPRKLIAKRGQDLKYYLNGIEKKIIGQVGDPAKVYVNNKLTDLEHKLKHKDIIIVDEATSGKSGRANIYDIVDINKKIYLNGKPYDLVLSLSLNGERVSENHELKNEDKIDVSEIKTIYELFDYLDLDINNFKCYKDEKEIHGDYILNKDDMIAYSNLESNKEYNNKDGLNRVNKVINLNINGELNSINYDKDCFKFIDIFNYIDFDINKPKGNLILEVNGDKAQYQQKLKDGDIIKVCWQD